MLFLLLILMLLAKTNSLRWLNQHLHLTIHYLGEKREILGFLFVFGVFLPTGVAGGNYLKQSLSYSEL